MKHKKALTLTDASEALMIKCCETYHDYCRRWAEHGTPITLEETMRLLPIRLMPISYGSLAIGQLPINRPSNGWIASALSYLL